MARWPALLTENMNKPFTRRVSSGEVLAAVVVAPLAVQAMAEAVVVAEAVVGVDVGDVGEVKIKGKSKKGK